PLGLSGLEPGSGIDRLASLADLEIQLRARAAAAVSGRAERVPGVHALSDGLVKPLIVAVQAHVAIAVIDDAQQPQTRKPVGIDDSAAIDGPHGCAAIGCHQYAVPLDAAGALLAEPGNQLATDRPRELASQPCEGVVAVDGKLLDRTAQLGEQLLESALLALETLEALGARIRFGCQTGQHVRAP